MDVNLELVKQIISSDELCDKVNSGDNKETYINQIKEYILKLINEDVSSNMEYIIRYLKKFVINKEDIFFNNILLKLYSLDLKNKEFLELLETLNFNNIKQLLIKKYDEIIKNKTKISKSELIKILNLYCYTNSKYILPVEYINYLVYYIYSMKIELNYDLISYFYKQFALSFAESKNLNTTFVILDEEIKYDPYYDNIKNKIVLYKKNIKNQIDESVLADIFYQITYLYILKGINDNKIYTYEQLKLVKEICLISILGSEYYEKNYGEVSYSTYLKKQSINTVSNYFNKLGLELKKEEIIDTIKIEEELDDETDKIISIDILFDTVLKKENPNLISTLVRNYPILGSEYKNNKKKSLLTLIQDIYNNKKLLVTLNKDLEWHNKKSKDPIVQPKIEKLNNKISVCTSYIGVMNSIIMNGDLTSYDLLRSISDLITYNHSNKLIKNDTYLVLSEVIPKKIKKLCQTRNKSYKENLKKKIIKCYLDSMSLIKNNQDTLYFMKIYSTLEFCISALDVD